MRWLPQIRSGIRIMGRALKQAVTYLEPRAYRFIFRDRTIDYRRQVRRESSTVVMACVQWVMRTFPEAPVCLEKMDSKGEVERIKAHPMLDLIRKPNAHFSGRNLWACTLMDYHLYGNAYWLKIRNRGGRVAQLWWVPSQLIRPVSTSPTDYISHYEYRGRPYPVEDVVHFRFGLAPSDMKVGISPLASAGIEIFSDQEAADWTASMLRNGGIPGLVISPKVGAEQIDAGDLIEIREYLQEQYTGPHRGKPMAVPQPVDIESFGFNPRQMNLAEIRYVCEERISSLTGIPGVVVGLGSGLRRSTFANVSEAREMAYENNIIPSQPVMGEALDNQLLPDFDPDPMLRTAFDISKIRVLQEDHNELAARYRGLWKDGMIPRSVGLKALGLPFEKTDEVFQISNSVQLVPVGEMPPEPEPPDPSPDGEDDDDEMSNSRFFSLLTDTRGSKQLTDAQLSVLSILDAGWRKGSKSLTTRLVPLFEQLGVEIARAAEVVLDPDLFAKRVAGEVELKIGEEAVTAQIMAEASTQAIRESFRQAVTGHYLEIATETFQKVGHALDITIGMTDEAANRIVSAGGVHLGLVDLDEQAKQRLFTDLATGRMLGEGKDELIRRIRDSVPKGPWTSSRIRAEVIARTETKNAQRVSTLEGYETSGSIYEVEMIDARLGHERSDPDCIARVGRRVSFIEAEAERLSTATHPRCTLDYLPIVE